MTKQEEYEQTRPLRVLHLVPGLALGGAETLLYALATRRSGIEHQVICLGGRDWYSDRLEEHGVKVEHLGIRSLASAGRELVRLRGLMRRARADVLQTWMYRANVVGGVIARTLGLPVAWSIHASSLAPLRFSSRMFGYAGGVIAPWASDYVINCAASSARIHGRLGYSRAPGAVIHNGYDVQAFAPDESAREATRRALGVPDDIFLVGSISRWDPYKDIPTLLSAIGTVSRDVPLRCMLIGAGLDSVNSDLAQAMERAGCGIAAMPLGRRADLPDLARAMDLHVLSSASEAFPNVICETMLSGTPNAVTDVGDTRLILGDTGWLVPPRDPQALAEAMRAAWAERSTRPDDWERRRAAARERIAERFTFERMAQAYEEVWRNLARRCDASAADG
jgi:glycosyltransferase involved in cell wall biosynthesis